MAKKGGAQQVQVDITTDEEFEAFIDRYREPLIILDVYSGWSGPCTAVLSNLKKIKLELGGDRLQLATCKTDHITRLRRFRRKSEPTWLFIRNGKSINLMFGTNVPKLTLLITTELSLLKVPLAERRPIEIDQLHPEEQRREEIKYQMQAEIEEKERILAERKRRAYLLHCTDTIMENMPDMGVSIFGPQVTRDSIKEIVKPTEQLKISIKDRRFQYVTREEFDKAFYFCRNPLPDNVIEEMMKYDVLLCFWKKSDEMPFTVTQVLRQYAVDLTKSGVEPADENNEERVIPPILQPLKLKVEYEVEDYVTCPIDEDDPPKEKAPSIKEEAEAEVQQEDEGEGEPGAGEAPPPDFDQPDGDAEDANEEEEEIEAEPIDVGPPPKKICTKTVIMPPVWVPFDERTHAALIYTFFRAQTFSFLPPDPPPEPPHVIMAFDAYKKRDLISVIERNRSEIPCYGFFSSHEADEAKFIAKTVQDYSKKGFSADDKLVLKVNKRTSHMMLSLATYGATYVSPDTGVGKEEAKIFFPEGYLGAEEEAAKQEAGKADGNAGAEQPTEGETFDTEDVGEGADGTELGEEEFMGAEDE